MHDRAIDQQPDGNRGEQSPQIKWQFVPHKQARDQDIQVGEYREHEHGETREVGVEPAFPDEVVVHVLVREKGDNQERDDVSDLVEIGGQQEARVLVILYRHICKLVMLFLSPRLVSSEKLSPYNNWSLR